MEVVFDRSFLKAITKLKDKELKLRIEKLIVEVEQADTLADIKHLKKMEGFKTFYRIRVGDYRVGIELESKKLVRFITIAHRKDIYSIFP